jgi:hypothetical protein
MCKTNPTSRLRIADCGLKTDPPRDASHGLPPRACAGQTCKQTQLAVERREGQVLYGQRVMVNLTSRGLQRNKANSREPARPGGRQYKQTQFLPLCRSGDRRSREGNCVKQTQSGGAARRAGTERAKQTQLPEAGHRDGVPPGSGGTGPERRGTRDKCAKRTQFPAAERARHPNPRSIMRNKAKLGRAGVSGDRRAAGASRAKQSQFSPPRRARYPSIPLFYHSTIRIRCPLCKTNPIAGLGYPFDSTTPKQ